MARIVLIPAAGEGSRFRKAGILSPKPLIQVKGKTLLELTLNSFSFQANDQLMLVVQRRHNVRKVLSDRLYALHPKIKLNWLEIDELLPGQLATSAAGVKSLLKKYPDCYEDNIWIHNCDTGFQWSENLNEINTFASMPVFEAEGEHWSFGKPDPQHPDRAIEIAEKQRISGFASIGLYGFKSANEFLKLAEDQLKSPPKVHNEHYVAPLLQKALEAGNEVMLPKVQGIRLYGTPEELCCTFGISQEELLSSNQKSINAT